MINLYLFMLQCFCLLLFRSCSTFLQFIHHCLRLHSTFFQDVHPNKISFEEKRRKKTFRIKMLVLRQKPSSELHSQFLWNVLNILNLFCFVTFQLLFLSQISMNEELFFVRLNYSQAILPTKIAKKKFFLKCILLSCTVCSLQW